MSTIVPLTPLPAPNNLASGSIYVWSDLRAWLSEPITLPRTHIDLFRHGESITNSEKLITGRTDVALTQRGREQACQAGAKLRHRYDIACSSSLRRSYETLAIALECGKVKADSVYSDFRLDERSLGELELSQQRPIAQFAQGDLTYAPLGGESYLDLIQRSLSFLVDLACFARHRNKSMHVLLSTHVGPMRILCGIFWELLDASEVLALHFDNAEPVRIELQRLRWPSFIAEELYNVVSPL